jgi:transcriptional regulator GlxA family with amidase domain
MRKMIFPTAAVAVLLSAAAPSPEGPARAQPAAQVAAATRSDRLTLPPPKAGRSRPLVVVIADNAGAETTDFVIPYGVLKESGLAEVRSLSTEAGPVQLFRSLTVRADQTLADFESEQPAGADIVVVPAQIRADNPVLLAWLRSQAARGATIVSVCEGARVLANAGLLEGRRATTHWHALPELAKRHPGATWVRDRRYVQDGPIISTTGVSASVPMSLALVEAIGGTPAATALAQRLGASSWSAEHRTADYRLSALDYAHALFALGAFWRHETLQAPLTDGFDEIALALQADAWSRTFRASVATAHSGRQPVVSRRGLVFIPDAEPNPGLRPLPVSASPPLQQLDAAVADIRNRYGERAARLTALGLEYAPPSTPPRRPPPADAGAPRPLRRHDR